MTDAQKPDLQEIVKTIENVETKYENQDSYITYSDLFLSDEQKDQLSFCDKYTPLNIHLLVQFDKYTNGNRITSLEILSFATNEANDFAGFSFSIIDQQYFDIKKLTNKKKAVKLSERSKITALIYYTVYARGLTNIDENSQNSIVRIIYSRDNPINNQTVKSDNDDKSSKTIVKKPEEFITNYLGLSNNLIKYTICFK